MFTDQDEVLAAFEAGELDRDVIVVVRFQGPRANGMPELHKLTPALGVLQDRGHKWPWSPTGGCRAPRQGSRRHPRHARGALRRPARASCATATSCACAAARGELAAMVDPDDVGRARAQAPAAGRHTGSGRELFAFMRAGADSAEQGASAMLAAAGL